MSLIEAVSHTSRTLVDGTWVLQVHIEPRFRDAAMALFGAPGTAMALAALVTSCDQSPTPAAASTPEPAAKRERMTPLCEWAVMRCGEPTFQLWIGSEYDRTMGGDGSCTGDKSPYEQGGWTALARHAILVLCDITSRKELDTDRDKALLFDKLIRRPYADWLNHRDAN